MKKWTAIILATVMIFSLVALSACSDKQGTDTPGTSAPTAAPAPATDKPAPAEPTPDNTVYKLIVSTHTPSTTSITLAFKQLLDKITERSGGRLVFDVFTDGTLSGAPGIVDAIESGIADIGVVNAGRLEGRLNLVDVPALPGMVSNSWEAIKAYMELIDTSKPIQDEFASVGLVPLGVFFSGGFVTASKTEITDLSQLAGLKVSIPNSNVAGIMSEIGAIPMNVANPDSYEAISKGTVDALCSNSFNGYIGFGIHEVAKYMYMLEMGSGPLFYCIGSDAYAKLPDDLKQLIHDVMNENIADVTYKIDVLQEGVAQTVYQTFEAAGGKFVYPTDEQKSAFRNTYGVPIWNKWADDMAAKGLAGREVLDDFTALMDKYRGKCPY